MMYNVDVVISFPAGKSARTRGLNFFGPESSAPAGSDTPQIQGDEAPSSAQGPGHRTRPDMYGPVEVA